MIGVSADDAINCGLVIHGLLGEVVDLHVEAHVGDGHALDVCGEILALIFAIQAILDFNDVTLALLPRLLVHDGVVMRVLWLRLRVVMIVRGV